MLKRAFDVFFSIAGLAVLVPPFLIIGIVIKVDSAGPVFFLQQRVGKQGRLFYLLKFRTMFLNADKLTAITVGRRDPRITPVGYFLRTYKIDELPQLINVLKGDMSFVGPRPELKKFVDLYNEQQQQVISVKPGITDYASIQFRNENELLEGQHDPVNFYIKEIMPVKLGINLQYIKDQSFWLDIKIIFKTVFYIFSRS